MNYQAGSVTGCYSYNSHHAILPQCAPSAKRMPSEDGIVLAHSEQAANMTSRYDATEYEGAVPVS